MSIPVLCGDKWHPADIVRKGLAPLESNRIKFDFIVDAQGFSKDIFEGTRTIILSKSNNISEENEYPWMSEAIELSIQNFVNTGGGLLVIHSGTAGYSETTTLGPLMGGVFTHHPEQCPVKVEMKEKHYMTEGCSDFTLPDEHYFMDISDDEIDIFMTTESLHGTQPGGWIKKAGKGRICVLTPGHNLDIWLHTSFQRLLSNSLDWCLGDT